MRMGVMPHIFSHGSLSGKAARNCAARLAAAGRAKDHQPAPARYGSRLSLFRELFLSRGV